MLVLLSAFVGLAFVFAQEKGQKSAESGAEPPPHPQAKCPATDAASLHYEFGWNGIPAARAIVKIRKAIFEEKPVIRLLANAETVGLVKRLWKMEDRVEALVHPETLKPVKVEIHREEGGKTYRTNISYFPKTCKARVVNVKDGGKVKKKEVECGDAYDPLTLILLVRCLKFEVGKTVSFEVFEGDEIYRVFLDVKRKEKIKVEAGTFRAFVMEPSFRKLPIEKDDDDDDSKVDKVTIWVADLPERYLLKVKSKVFVGNIYGELTDID